MKKIIFISASVFVVIVTTIVVLVLVFSSDSNVTVKFHSDNIMFDLDDIILGSNESFELPTPDPIEGYEFIGWFFDEEHNDPFTMERFNELISSKQNISIYSKFVEIITYQVIFLVDDVSFLEISVENDFIINEPIEIPSKEGYEFIGWYDNNGLFNFATPITNNLTLTANFLELEEVIVTFDLDGGIGLETLTLYEGDLLSIINNPTKEGYDFDGWLLDGYSFDEGNPILNNITLTASWNVKVLEIELIIGGVSHFEYLNYGSHINSINDPFKENHTFGGWLDSSNNIFSDIVTNELTLTALFDPITWTVTFDTEGGTPIDNITVLNGSKILEEVVTTKEGYTFRNWWAQELLNHFNFETMVVTQNLSLIAEWDEQIVVTLDYNSSRLDPNDILVTEILIDAGDTLVGLLPMLETEDGYIVHWEYYGNQYMDERVYDDVIIKAIWHYYLRDEHTVTLINWNTNEVMDTLTILDGDPFIYDEPTMVGYRFDKWIYNNQEFMIGTPVTDNLIIYATWVSVFVELNFIREDGMIIRTVVFQEGREYYPVFYQTIEGDDGVTYSKVYLDEEMTLLADETIVLMSDLNLYVRELNKFNIRFYDSDGLHFEIVNHTEGNPLYSEDMPRIFRKGNLLLDYWVDINGVRLDSNYFIYEEMVFYAVMKEEPIKENYAIYVTVMAENYTHIDDFYINLDFEEEITIAYMQNHLDDLYPNMYTVIEVLFNGYQAPIVIIQDGYMIINVTTN